MNRVFLTFLALALSGCTVGPNYHRPCVCVPCEWRTELHGNEEYVNTLWWKMFDDPVLDCLIETALAENKDLLIATARVFEFMGRYRSTRGVEFPQLGAAGSFGREKVSERVTPLAALGRNPDNFYQLMLTGSWEIDLWGKLRRATEAACAEVLASEYARQNVVQTLVTAVATAYIDLLRLDRQLEIAIETAATRKTTLDIFELRYAAGVISKVELSQIQSEYEDAMAAIPVFENQISQQENSLSVLLGRNPGPIPRGKTINTIVMPQIPDQLPSNLLCQRPDIREAEEILHAANARIGVAKAQYFPDISITADYGKGSRALADLFTGGATTWSYFVPVTMPLFTGGRIAGDVQTAEAIKTQAVENYKLSLLNAFSEVDSSLINYEKTSEQLRAQVKQVAALSEYAYLARLRYDEGYTSYLEVLDAERSLFNAQLDSTETLANRYIGMIDIYKSMGGGWICLSSP